MCSGWRRVISVGGDCWRLVRRRFSSGRDDSLVRMLECRARDGPRCRPLARRRGLARRCSADVPHTADVRHVPAMTCIHTYENTNLDSAKNREHESEAQAQDD